jgi:hypothetical protein
MITLIAFLITSLLRTPATAGAQGRSNFERLFPYPTGQNGLEEYVRAGDLLSGREFNTYQSWVPPERRPSAEELRQQAEADKTAQANASPEMQKVADDDMPKLTEEEIRLNDHVNDLNYLQLKQEEVKRFQAALDLMAEGNRKQFAFGPASGAASLWVFPDRQLSKLASDAAYVEFANGKSGRATEILDEALYMYHRMSSGGIVDMLSGIGSTAVINSQFNNHLDALSSPDAKQVARLAGELLDDVSGLESMIQNERAQDARLLEETMKELREPSPAEANSPIVREYQALGADQQAGFARQTSQSMNADLDTASRIFQGPEGNWMRAADETNPESEVQNGTGDVDDSDQPKTLAQLGSQLRGVCSMVLGHYAVLAIMRSRTQLRLLRLHAEIIEYRWETGALPKTIQSMQLPEAETNDLLSGKSFQYILHDRTYELFSLGIPETGKIELRYRRTGNGAVDTSAVP